MITPVDYNAAKTQLLNAQSDMSQAKYEFIFKTKVLDFYKGLPLNLNQIITNHFKNNIMKSNKILKILIAVVVVLLVFAVIGKKAGWFGKAATVKVAVEYAEKREITETITANGKIQPEKEVKITPDVSGEIVELNRQRGRSC